MSCAETPKTSSCGGGCGCSAPAANPWLGALLDPGLRMKVLRRYRAELLLGAGAGLAAAAVLLLLGDRLGPLGPALGGPWLQLHPGALFPAFLAAGIAVALRTGQALGGTLLAAGLCLALGGGLNALLTSGGAAAAAAFPILGLPLAALAALLVRSPQPGSCR